MRQRLDVPGPGDGVSAGRTVPTDTRIFIAPTTSTPGIKHFVDTVNENG